MTVWSDERGVWVGDHFGIREFDQPLIVLNKFIGFQGWKQSRVKQQILFHFILDDFCKHEPAKPRRA